MSKIDRGPEVVYVVAIIGFHGGDVGPTWDDRYTIIRQESLAIRIATDFYEHIFKHERSLGSIEEHLKDIIATSLSANHEVLELTWTLDDGEGDS
jgi:hypothetical protein